MNKKSLIVLSILWAICSPDPLLADAIVLKSGKTVEGKIIEKTDGYIKINCYDVPLTFFLDEIDYIKPDKEFSGNIAQLEQKSFLWKVTSQLSTVYLFGSIHIAKEDMYPLQEEVERAFNVSDVLAVEVDLNNIGHSKRQKIFKETIYPPQETLQQHLSKETFELLRDKLSNLNINIVNFLNYKPWLLSLQLTEIALLKLGYDSNMGLDLYFLRKAEGKKKISELESFDFQIDLLSKFTDKEQDLLLYYTIINLDNIERQMDRLVQAWKWGDVKYMEKILFSAFSQYPEMSFIYERIFVERNKNMALKIEGFLNMRNTYFVVVGAGHLTGQDSIIYILQEKGYPVQQL